MGLYHTESHRPLWILYDFSTCTATTQVEVQNLVKKQTNKTHQSTELLLWQQVVHWDYFLLATNTGPFGVTSKPNRFLGCKKQQAATENMQTRHKTAKPKKGFLHSPDFLKQKRKEKISYIE